MRRFSSLLLALLLAPSMASAATHVPPYSDVPKDSWAAPYIGYLAAKGHISSAQTLYRPLDPMTRAELAKVLAGVRKLPLLARANTFCDVPSEHWANQYVNALRTANVVQGIEASCGRLFEPERPVSRVEALKMVLGTFGISTSSAASIFTDVPSGSWYAPYVMKAYERGIARGPGNGLFNPTGLITRQELAKIVVLTLDPSDFDPPGGAVAPVSQPPAPTGPVCGNGKVEYGEYCDDGNRVSGDGCDSICELEMTRLPVCGNGTCETNEKTTCSKDCA